VAAYCTALLSSSLGGKASGDADHLGRAVSGEGKTYSSSGKCGRQGNLGAIPHCCGR
jgi:hypothetical protein